MPILDLLFHRPYSCVALCLYLGAIFSAMRLVSVRRYGPDRLLLALLGLVSTYQGAILLQEAGVWLASMDARATGLANIAVGGLCLTAVYVIALWSREHLAVKGELRLAEASVPAVPDANVWGSASPELLAAALQALPFSVTITDSRNKTLFANNVDPASPSEQAWTVPVGNSAASCQMRVIGLAAPVQASRMKGPVPLPMAVASEDPSRDRRSQLRLLLEQPVPIEVQVLDGSEWKTTGHIADFSGGGLGLDIQEPVAVGAALLIVMNDALVLGEVCYCRPSRTGYRAGLRAGQFLMADSFAKREKLAPLPVVPVRRPALAC